MVYLLKEIKAAVAEIMYSDVDQDIVEKTSDDIVIDVAHSAISNMLVIKMSTVQVFKPTPLGT